jgi:hypothetical protein
MVKIIKIELSESVVQKPWEKGLYAGNASETQHQVTDDGGLKSKTIQLDKLFHCGCPGQIGGCCGDCSNLICDKCFVRCDAEGCGKPLGPCCARSIKDKNGLLLHFCKTCFGEFRRHRLVRIFLSPFIQFED